MEEVKSETVTPDFSQVLHQLQQEKQSPREVEGIALDKVDVTTKSCSGIYFYRLLPSPN